MLDGRERRVGVYTRNIKSHPKVSSKDQFNKNEDIQIITITFLKV